jgi:hypothetical protein
VIPKEFAQVHLALFPSRWFQVLWRNVNGSSQTSFRFPSKFFAKGKVPSFPSFSIDGQLPAVALFPFHCPSSAQFGCRRCDNFYIHATEASLDSLG